VFGDGDVCVDADGTIYTIVEDEWALLKYHADLDGFERIGSGYGGAHPSGLAIGPSTDGSGSTTGWSLYATDYNNLWEKPSFPAPAPVLVDASLGLTVGRTLAGSTHPRYGKPSVLAPAPVAGGTGLLVGTRSGWLLAFDPATGTISPVAGPEDGLEGELVALASSPEGRRVVAFNAAGGTFELVGGRVRPVRADPGLVQGALAGVPPQRTARVRDRWTRTDEWFQIDGWALWRLVEAP
jgi:hypothetical protein